jgi:flagellar basal-body rod modification protein FlgD
MTTSVIPATTSTLFATPTTSATNAVATTASNSNQSQIDFNNQIAGNFTSFLQLLTTQLQNQNPLDPLDTNQFTAQLVQFASVEQQMNMNTQLQTLVSLQQATQSSQAMGFAGATVTVQGSSAALTNGQAQWNYSSPVPATATFTITDASGQTVYQTTQGVQPGLQHFNWDGTDGNGNKLPDGNYSMSITATSADGKNFGLATTVTGTVDSVDLTKSPPLLSIGGQFYTVNQILQVQKPGSSGLF